MTGGGDVRVPAPQATITYLRGKRIMARVMYQSDVAEVRMLLLSDNPHESVGLYDEVGLLYGLVEKALNEMDDEDDRLALTSLAKALRQQA